MLRRQQVSVGITSTNAEVLGSRHQAAGAQLGSSLFDPTSGRSRRAGDRSDGRLALFQALGIVIVSWTASPSVAPLSVVFDGKSQDFPALG